MFVSKKLEEREKEVQKFYESESESDEEQVIPDEGAKNIENDTITDTCMSTNHNQTDIEEDFIDSVVIDKCTKAEEALTNLIQKDSELTNLETKEPECYTSENPTCIVTETNREENSATEHNSTIIPDIEALIPNAYMNDKSNLPKDDTRESLKTSENTTCDNVTTTEEDKHASEDYTFNLDDISMEDIDCNNDEDDRLNALVNKYNGSNKDDQEKKTHVQERMDNRRSVLQLYKENITDKPKLNGTPDELIDLTGSAKQTGITHLIERFMKHAYPQNATKDKVQLK